MWSLISRRYQTTIILVIGILIAYSLQSLFAYFKGAETPLIGYISLVVSILLGLLVSIADIIIFWMLRKFPQLQVMTFPDLNGIWKGDMISTWIDPETDKPIPPIPTTITIRQKFFSTHISLKTRESRSESTRAVLERFPETKRFRVWYSYNNDPIAQVKKRSSPHEGVAYLEMHWDEDKNTLTGTYYTSRSTIGSIKVIRSV